MDQQPMPPQLAQVEPQQPQVTKKKTSRDIFVEIAGGYLLGATIMAFVGLWTIGVSRL